MAAQAWLFGTWGGDNGMAAACGQANGIWPITTIYNNHQLFANTGDWNAWADLDANSVNPHLHIQISPAPGGAAFDANDWSTNHQAQFDQLAKNVASQYGSRCVSCSLGWEWNKGGACDKGWDHNSANRSLYIRFFRNLATSFAKYAPGVIRVWAMNHNVMTDGSTPEDWYPGDKYVDAIGIEMYTQYGGDTSGNGGFGNYPWIDKMSAATYLGSGHPGTVDGEVVTFGGEKYIVFAEGQDSTGSNGINCTVEQMIQWCQNPVRVKRMLVFVYWNNDGYGGLAMRPTNAEGQQCISLLNGSSFNGPWPTPLLSSGGPVVAPPPPPVVAKIAPSPDNTVVKFPSVSVIGDAQGNSWAITASQQVSYNGVVIAYTAAVDQLAKNVGMFQHGSGQWGSFGALDANGVPTCVWPIAASPLTGTVVTPPPPPAIVPSISGTIISKAVSITDSTGAIWAISAGGQVEKNNVADTTTANVINLAYVSGALWSKTSDGLWHKQSATGTWGAGQAKLGV